MRLSREEESPESSPPFRVGFRGAGYVNTQAKRLTANPYPGKVVWRSKLFNGRSATRRTLPQLTRTVSDLSAERTMLGGSCDLNRDELGAVQYSRTFKLTYQRAREGPVRLPPPTRCAMCRLGSEPPGCLSCVLWCLQGARNLQ